MRRSNIQSQSQSFDNFVPDKDMNECQRAAAFLDWVAINFPGRFAPYVWICKHAYNKQKLPKITDADVETLRKRLGRIKEVLWNKYHRRTEPASRGLEPGMRGTTDSDDLAGTAYLRQNRRIANGIKAAAETREKIDINEMHNADLKSMVQRTDPIIKKFMMADLMKKLELPSPSDD